VKCRTWWGSSKARVGSRWHGTSADAASLAKSFWARRYFVLTVGLDEEMVRKYIRDPKKEDQRLDQAEYGLI